ncbi:MAG: preprotein translocase subunit SecY [Saprospiraceae bacterium]|nr:preprotein translocase subunit SecY [Saprospiraceae bacterium]
MKRFIETLQNIWKIKDLRDRIIFALGMIAIYRFGSYVVLPGVNPEVLQSAAGQGGANDLLDLVNMFAGGAFNRAAVFALGIMPYITASIIIQLMGFAVPYFQRLQQKEGESGRKKITQITRLLTLAITLVQGGAYLTYVRSQGAVDPTIPPGIFWLANIIILSTGTIFAMWLGERITDKGIGNGISLLIMIGIIATLPGSLIAEFITQLNGGGLIIFVLELAALFFVTMVTVLVIQGIRKIPLQFAKRMVGRGINMPVSGVRDYIPVKVAAAGVMPIIFAQAIMFIPSTVAQFVGGQTGADIATNPLVQSLSDPFAVPYNIIYFFLVVAFTFVYTALLVNPTQYADYLKRQNAFIPGVKPGKPTADFIDTVTSRVTLPGSIFLGLISILPAVVYLLFGVNQTFAFFFGGTSLLILVGVVLDTLQQIESHLLMRKYDGLVKSGKLKGRSSMQTIGSDL